MELRYMEVTRVPSPMLRGTELGATLPPMSLLANIMVGLVAAIHVYILVLEMYLWDKPAGLRAFGQSLEQARASKTLAANQGLYNGFLAAGLIWGLVADHGFHIKIFFLTCVIIAGVYGAVTASRKILWVQAMPALIALVLLHFP